MKRHFGISIDREGLKFICILFLVLFVLNALIIGFIGGLVSIISLCLSLVVFLFFSNFFRCPKRFHLPQNPYEILAPADGKVVVIEPVFENSLLKRECLQVSIFMSIIDVHANWVPFNGTVTHYSHRDGRYQAAWLPKSSSENEHTSIIMETDVNRQKILVRQIAGAMARRIVSYVHTGKHCHINEHLGFIKFGSRVDMFFPLDSVEMAITIGTHVTGNKTVIAHFKK